MHVTHTYATFTCNRRANHTRVHAQHTNICTSIHMHTFTYLYVHMRVHTRTYIPAHLHVQTHRHTLKYTCLFENTTRIQIHTHTRVPTIALFPGLITCLHFFSEEQELKERNSEAPETKGIGARCQDPCGEAEVRHPARSCVNQSPPPTSSTLIHPTRGSPRHSGAQQSLES